MGSCGYESATADSSDDGKDGELYPKIGVLFKERKLEAAEHEIGKLPNPELDCTLGKGHRYGILRLKAQLALERLQFDEAARLFTLAYETCPDLQEARQNRVLALTLSVDRKKAFAEAENLLVDGFRSAFLVSLLVRNASLPGRHPPISRRDRPVHFFRPGGQSTRLWIGIWRGVKQTLLMWRAMGTGYCSRVCGHALLFRGMVAHRSAFEGGWQNRPERLTDAIGYYSRGAHCR